MNINTLSIVIGSRACDAHCPFCVSRLTGFDEVAGARPATAIRDNFQTACQYARIGNVTTVLFTGKGEPTLYPLQIQAYLEALTHEPFPFKELQTNGLQIGHLAQGQRQGPLTEALLKRFRVLGLKTICLSVVGVYNDWNAAIYNPDYPDLADTVAYLRRLRYTIRLSVMMQAGMVDHPEMVAKVIAWCREHRVAQLTIRPIRKPDDVSDKVAGEYVRKNGLTEDEEATITRWVQEHGHPILHLSHGAVVYDLDGQNVCLTDCLTVPEEVDHIRTLIYYHSGRIAYHWQYPGSVLLDGDDDREDK